MEVGAKYTVERHRAEDIELQHARPLEHAGKYGREGKLEDRADLGEHLDEREEDLGAYLYMKVMSKDSREWAWELTGREKS